MTTQSSKHQFNNEVKDLGERKGYPKCLWQNNMSTSPYQKETRSQSCYMSAKREVLWLSPSSGAEARFPGRSKEMFLPSIGATFLTEPMIDPRAGE